jgi:hypothetical protein
MFALDGGGKTQKMSTKSGYHNTRENPYYKIKTEKGG